MILCDRINQATRFPTLTAATLATRAAAEGAVEVQLRRVTDLAVLPRKEGGRE